MINFFRKIRQQLFTQQKTATTAFAAGRYLKYALGEIVLVVIGILLALQINNWNEARKANAEELKILNALQADFVASKERIETTIKMQTRTLRHSITLSEIYERGNLNEQRYFNTHLDSLSHLLGYGMSWYREELVTGAYHSLISAGKIDLIQSENLRNLLAQFIADFESGFEDHESSMMLLQKLYEEVNHFYFIITSNTFRKKLKYPPRKIDSLDIATSFFSNHRYFGNLYLKSIDERNRLERQKDLLKQIETILETIKNELLKHQSE